MGGEPFFLKESSCQLNNMISGRNELPSKKRRNNFHSIDHEVSPNIVIENDTQTEMIWVSFMDNNIEKKRILIVDDQLFNINALTIMLRCFTNIDPENVCDTAMDGK